MSKSKLGELFLTVAEEELMIERQRQNLASLREFEPYAAFTRVDRDHKGYITAKDIAIFVRLDNWSSHFIIEVMEVGKCMRVSATI